MDRQSVKVVRTQVHCVPTRSLCFFLLFSFRIYLFMENKPKEKDDIVENKQRKKERMDKVGDLFDGWWEPCQYRLECWSIFRSLRIRILSYKSIFRRQLKHLPDEEDLYLPVSSDNCYSKQILYIFSQCRASWKITNKRLLLLSSSKR